MLRMVASKQTVRMPYNQPKEDHMELVIVFAGAVAMLVVSLAFQRASYKKMGSHK